MFVFPTFGIAQFRNQKTLYSHRHNTNTHKPNSFERDNVGMLVFLRLKSNPSIIILVANTHLFWNPEREVSLYFLLIFVGCDFERSLR